MAEKFKEKANEREEQERVRCIEDGIAKKIELEEARMRTQQQMALAALLKRIQRDRNEQLKHRQLDSQRLIQRNKNLVSDMLNKQRMEEKRTDEFLKYALGARSPEKTNYYKSKYMNKNYRLKYTAARDKNNSFFMSSEHFNRKSD